MQLVLRIANTVSVIFVVILFVNIWVDGVCTNAADQFGQKRFPSCHTRIHHVRTRHVRVALCGWMLLQIDRGMETAFFTPKPVSSKEMTYGIA